MIAALASKVEPGAGEVESLTIASEGCWGSDTEDSQSIRGALDLMQEEPSIVTFDTTLEKLIAKHLCPAHVAVVFSTDAKPAHVYAASVGYEVASLIKHDEGGVMAHVEIRPPEVRFDLGPNGLYFDSLGEAIECSDMDHALAIRLQWHSLVREVLSAGIEVIEGGGTVPGEQ